MTQSKEYTIDQIRKIKIKCYDQILYSLRINEETGLQKQVNQFNRHDTN